MPTPAFLAALASVEMLNLPCVNSENVIDGASWYLPALQAWQCGTCKFTFCCLMMEFERHWMVFQIESALCKNKYQNISLARMVSFTFPLGGRQTHAHHCPVFLQSRALNYPVLKALLLFYQWRNLYKHPKSPWSSYLGAITPIGINFPYWFYCLSEAIWDFISLLFHRVCFSWQMLASISQER